MNSPLPFHLETILAIDFGTKVTGIATYTPGSDPFPLLADRIINKGREQLIQAILERCEAEGVVHVVLGVPYLLDGKSSSMTEKVLKFGEQLKQAGVESLFFQDETLTTKEAEDRMLSSPRFNFKIDLKLIDSLSASIILEDFLSEKGHSF
ncbi:MAG: Holliday junction resolvase RuvX [Halobacteriovoraceae bacterium]|jgi:putative holliday junction resolvase|nr:Holliday junction resolvase RuvX [Halobacteriovoraceae bacterium]MBT5095100.1 Holliday junction resolvase RuvX [Halobacteriovoraceae bacterium]